MTPATAIEQIKKVVFCVENEIEEIKASKFITALKTAISALENRYRRGWSDERIINTPIRKYRKAV